jgi:hypothetical protein
MLRVLTVVSSIQNYWVSGLLPIVRNSNLTLNSFNINSTLELRTMGKSPETQQFWYWMRNEDFLVQANLKWCGSVWKYEAKLCVLPHKVQNDPHKTRSFLISKPLGNTLQVDDRCPNCCTSICTTVTDLALQLVEIAFLISQKRLFCPPCWACFALSIFWTVFIRFRNECSCVKCW